MAKCGCNFPFLFPEYHWPHCPNNPDNLTGAAKTYMESRFTKAELATIAKQGPVKDEKLTSRKRVKRG